MSKTPLIAVLLVFIGFFFFPYFYNTASGQLGKQLPQLEKPKGDHCVEDAKWMEENHMVLLKKWRYMVLREGVRTYISDAYGTKYDMSTATCFKCHTSKANFCDKCHEYVGVKPNCWDCHVYPELVQEHNRNTSS